MNKTFVEIDDEKFLKNVDFRSDTVTFPTVEMRKAMITCDLGDDVFCEDPTVNALETRMAQDFGFEKGLFVSSGTQGNLIAVLCHCGGRGDEFIVGDKAHIMLYEQGGTASLGGAFPRAVPVQADGTLSLDAIQDAVRGNDVHYPISRLICLENTQGATGGQPLSAAYISSVCEVAKANSLKVHIDGARIYNAAAHFGIDVKELVRGVDSISVCLSKGLCAPVGSVLLGSSAFIHSARRLRKMLGGGMRQAGVLAAAGLVALDQIVPKLSADHANCTILAESFKRNDAVQVLSHATNMLFFKLNPAFPKFSGKKIEASEEALVVEMKKHNILLSFRANKCRLCTHYWISREKIDFFLLKFNVFIHNFN